MTTSDPLFRFLTVTFLSSLLLTGCSVFGDNGSSNSGPVRAQRVRGMIAIQNQGRDTLWTFEAGQRILARIDWRPSLELDGLPPGRTKTVALDAIPMGDDEERIVVFWWKSHVQDGQREPGNVSSLDVEL